ncbi:hypothetical protein [Streptomyces sp. NPDC040750]|uniref:hypothetical protein n=1 Tax=Streptomyces sp. NPDC040750 TaxID=3154491 RepID=UPI00340419A7
MQPDHGYQAERREADRVLYSFDVKGRAKVAVVAAKDQKGCPVGARRRTPLAIPPNSRPCTRPPRGWAVWTDRDGARVMVSRLESSTGAEHCGWQSVRFLALGGRTYVRDSEGVLARDGLLSAPYRKQVRMPAGAPDTGYHSRDRHLWLTEDQDTAYVRTSSGVEAWPRAAREVACK